jgi:hypothetical protein
MKYLTWVQNTYRYIIYKLKKPKRPNIMYDEFLHKHCIIHIRKDKQLAEEVQLFLYSKGLKWQSGECKQPIPESRNIEFIRCHTNTMTFSPNKELEHSYQAHHIEGRALIHLTLDADGNYW